MGTNDANPLETTMRSLSMHHDRVRLTGMDLSLAALARSLFDMVVAWQDRSRERAQLSGLDDRLLRDMGLTRAEVDRELNKAFWQR
jgi:uncharacterized protein YjiS (DUF1127 family)